MGLGRSEEIKLWQGITTPSPYKKSGQPDLCSVDELDVRNDLTEERREPMEDLVAISLDDGNTEHIVQIDSGLDGEVQKELVTFLWKNADAFA